MYELTMPFQHTCGPNISFDPVVARNSDVPGICHRSCGYTVLQTVQKYGACSAMVMCTIKYPCSHLIKVAHIRYIFFFCRNIAMIVQKAT